MPTKSSRVLRKAVIEIANTDETAGEALLDMLNISAGQLSEVARVAVDDVRNRSFPVTLTFFGNM
jgi:hypothetical protein